MALACLLIYGADYARREHYLAGLIRQQSAVRRAAVILEGIPAGDAALDDLANLISLQRLASGCFCCAGKLVFQVAIRRSLRHAPDFFALALNDASHAELLLTTLQSSDYANWFESIEGLQLPS